MEEKGPAKPTGGAVREAVSSVLKRRVVKPTEQRRKEILEASLELFADKGFHETTVDDVARQAGVAKGTIYLYFESKEHLLLALKRQFMTGLVEAVRQVIVDNMERLAVGESVDYRTVIDEIFEVLIGYHCEQRRAVEVVVKQSPGPDLMQDALELEREFLQLLTGAFREGTEQGLVHSDDPEMTARLVHAAVRDNLASCLCYQDPPDLERLVAAAKDLLYKVLAPPAGPRRLS